MRQELFSAYPLLQAPRRIEFNHEKTFSLPFIKAYPGIIADFGRDMTWLVPPLVTPLIGFTFALQKMEPEAKDCSSYGWGIGGALIATSIMGIQKIAELYLQGRKKDQNPDGETNGVNRVMDGVMGVAYSTSIPAMVQNGMSVASTDAAVHTEKDADTEQLIQQRKEKSKTRNAALLSLLTEAAVSLTLAVIAYDARQEAQTVYDCIVTNILTVTSMFNACYGIDRYLQFKQAKQDVRTLNAAIASKNQENVLLP